MVDISVLTMVYKPTYDCGGHHLAEWFNADVLTGPDGSMTG
jgi:hypothetical protein